MHCCTTCMPCAENSEPIWFTSSPFLQFPVKFAFSSFHSVFFFCPFLPYTHISSPEQDMQSVCAERASQCRVQTHGERNTVALLTKAEEQRECNLFVLCGAHSHAHGQRTLFLIPCCLYTDNGDAGAHIRDHTIQQPHTASTPTTTRNIRRENIFQFEIFFSLRSLHSPFSSLSRCHSTGDACEKHCVHTEQQQCAPAHAHTLARARPLRSCTATIVQCSRDHHQ